METIEEYEAALERLISNNPINVAKGTKINNDTVALEAGRKRGSIKKSRDIFSDLINKIKTASSQKDLKKALYEKKINKWKNKANDYRKLYEDTLNRELMLIEHVKNLEVKLEKATHNKISSLNNINYNSREC